MKNLIRLSEQTGVPLKVLYEIHGYPARVAAQILGVPEISLRKEFEKGRISGRKYPGIRFTLEDLTGYAKSRKIPAVSEPVIKLRRAS